MLDSCCAFTGHRPHKLPWRYNESDSRCSALKAALVRQITQLVDAGVTDFYSGGADGVDYEKRKVMRSEVLDAAQERYHSILEKADSVEYVSREYYDGCMLDRNHRLIEATGVLLAVYNGEWRGGTAATVRYARKLDRRIIILNPTTLEAAEEGGGVVSESIYSLSA